MPLRPPERGTASLHVQRCEQPARPVYYRSINNLRQLRASRDRIVQPVRIGIVGAGANMRSRHLPGFRAIAGVEVVCLANRTMESARRVATEFSIPRIHAH